MSKHASPLKDRFWPKVRKGPGCWLWMAWRMKNGYGTIARDNTGRKILAHRAAWTLTNGPIPRSLYVLHRCDNPRCVRPSHLFLGTQTDNMKDCATKGRQPGSNGKMRGEASPHAKLTWIKARAIRASKESGPTLARKYGVTHRVIYLIQKNLCWKENKCAA